MPPSATADNRHHRALGIADHGDAFGIDERLAREIEQATIGVHYPIDGRAGRNLMAALGDAARPEAVDEQDRVAEHREALRQGVLVLPQPAAAAAVQRHDGGEGTGALRAMQLAGQLGRRLRRDRLSALPGEALLQRRRWRGGAREMHRLGEHW